MRKAHETTSLEFRCQALALWLNLGEGLQALDLSENPGIADDGAKAQKCKATCERPQVVSQRFVSSSNSRVQKGHDMLEINRENVQDWPVDASHP